MFTQLPPVLATKLLAQEAPPYGTVLVQYGSKYGNPNQGSGTSAHPSHLRFPWLEFRPSYFPFLIRTCLSVAW